MSDDPVKFYTTDQVAAMFQVTSETVRGWINDGKLRASRIGRTFRCSPEDIREYAASRRT